MISNNDNDNDNNNNTNENNHNKRENNNNNMEAATNYHSLSTVPDTFIKFVFVKLFEQ